jgi:hypothetical protein
MPLERDFKKRVLKDLATLPKTWCVKVQQVAVAGTPDILLCWHGLFVAMELKRSKSEHPTKLQAYTLGKIQAADGIALEANPENWQRIFMALRSGNSVALRLVG